MPKNLDPFFERLWNTYHQSIFLFFYRQVYGPDKAQIAEDLLQETFAAAYRSLASMQGQGNEFKERTWIYRIAANKLTDWARRVKLIAWSPLEGVDRDDHHTAPDPQEIIPDQADLYEALAKLDSRQQTALLLYYRDGASHEEVAAALGLKPTGIKMYLSRALQALREYYQQTQSS